MNFNAMEMNTIHLTLQDNMTKLKYMFLISVHLPGRSAQCFPCTATRSLKLDYRKFNSQNSREKVRPRKNVKIFAFLVFLGFFFFFFFFFFFL